MKKNMYEWQRKQLENHESSVMPLIAYPGLALIGKTVRSAVTDGTVHAACIQAMCETYPSSAATSIMDLSVEAEAFGSTVTFAEHEVPTISGRIVQGADDIAALPLPEVGTKRTGQYIKAVTLSNAAVKDRPVFSGMIGPYSLAGRLFDITEIMTAVMIEPEVIHALLEKTCTFLSSYLTTLKNAGADGVLIAEPAAGLLSPDLCDEFSSGYVRQLVQATQDETFLVMLHNCGANKNHVPTMLSTGARCLHFGNNVSMQDILEVSPEDVLISGNIDPVGTIQHGTAEDISRAVHGLRASTQTHANFLLSTGCDVPPGTPLPNIEAFYTAAS